MTNWKRPLKLNLNSRALFGANFRNIVPIPIGYGHICNDILCNRDAWSYIQKLSPVHAFSYACAIIRQTYTFSANKRRR